ncbi:hypothetical protein BTO32_13095 [Marinobacter lutaoensis]|uniref:B box-type domain-containing protein n=1 Tax=Marinobacter lutaoensis TaxID=135739 RepID=A0A1V2DSC9_9GAMM|nr:B-box zinc finger protein [Marinobacter lutaoensis]ONF43588.1 hypothetical protein BTO32_13095 [Marinobacter lutaoensis]
MKPDCHYHPGDPAKWHCGQCQIHYCGRCMPDADPRRRRALCPQCSQAMRYLGAGTEVTPFWNRLGAFFRYPFHLDPLLVIAICTLVPLAAPANLFGLLLALALAVCLFKYTYAVIRHTADGHLRPPPAAVAFTGEGFQVVFLQLLVFVALGGLVAAAAIFGGALAMLLAMALVILALPASIMVLAMEQSVAAALHPLNLTALISRIGSPYFLLYGYLILLILASGAAQDFALSHFPAWLAMALAGFLNSTFTLILFHMLGYLLLQYRDELGLAPEPAEATAAPGDRDRSTRLDADIDMNLKDGHYDRVLALLKDALKREPDNPVRIGQLYRLLAARRDLRELYRYHPRILSWLADRNDGDAIAELLAALTETDPMFRLDDPGLSVDCARALYPRGHYKPALRLLQDFHKRFPDSDRLAGAYLLAAQALANGLGQWQKATAFLTFVKTRCAGQPMHDQVEAYLAQAAAQQPLKGPGTTVFPGE